MKSWKTTLGGILTALGMAALAIAQEPNVPHWVKLVGVGLSVFGPGLLGLAARDNSVTSEQAGAKPSVPPTVKLVSLLLPLALLASACTTARQAATQEVTTETTYPDGSIVKLTEKRTLDSSVLATGDAKQSIEKMRASNGKTLSLGTAGVQEDTSSENILNFLGKLVDRIPAAP